MTTHQFWTGVVVIILGYALGFYFQHRDYDHLERSINKRIDDLAASTSKRFDDLNKRIDDLKDWIRSEIKRLEERPVSK
jgi:hypothetical protein